MLNFHAASPDIFMAIALVAGWSFLLYPRRELVKPRIRSRKKSQKPQRVGGNQAWYRNVYLLSPHWRETRQRKIDSVGSKCERCKKKFKSLDVHHKDYSRLGHERMSDLEVLCRDCHNLEH